MFTVKYCSLSLSFNPNPALYLQDTAPKRLIQRAHQGSLGESGLKNMTILPLTQPAHIESLLSLRGINTTLEVAEAP